MATNKAWLLLNVVIFFIIAIYSWGMRHEGFIQFNYGVMPNTSSSVAQKADGTFEPEMIQKLFDNLYFHTRSATLIEIVGPNASSSLGCSSDNKPLVVTTQAGQTEQVALNTHITSIITKNSAGVVEPAFSNSQANSLLNYLQSSTARSDLREYQYYSTSSTSSNADATSTKYVVYILIRNTARIIHIVKQSDSLICATYLFQTGNNNMFIPSGVVQVPTCESSSSSPPPSDPIPRTTNPDNRGNDNKEKDKKDRDNKDKQDKDKKDKNKDKDKKDKDIPIEDEPFAQQTSSRRNGYDNDLVQMGPESLNLWFDPIRMNLVNMEPNGTIRNIYDRYGQTFRDKTTVTSLPPPGYNVLYSWELNVGSVMVHTIASPASIYVIVNPSLPQSSTAQSHYVYEFEKVSTPGSGDTPSTIPDPETAGVGGTSTSANASTNSSGSGSGNVATNTVQTTGTVVNNAVENVGNATAGAITAIGDVSTGAVGVANTVATTTGTVALASVQSAESVLNTVATASGNAVEKTIDTAGNTVLRTVDVAGNTITKTIDTAGTIVTTTVDEAGNTISNTVDAAESVLTGTSDNLAGVANNAIRTVESIVNNSVGAVFNTINQTVGGFYNLLKRNDSPSSVVTSHPVPSNPIQNLEMGAGSKHPYIVYPNKKPFQVQPMPASYASFA